MEHFFHQFPLKILSGKYWSNQKVLPFHFCRATLFLGYSMTLPTNFVRDVIMKASSHDIMNSLTKSVLTLASYDESVADMSLDNVLRQSLMLISVFPMLSVYGYHAVVVHTYFCIFMCKLLYTLVTL